ncbi:aminotransferase class IV [Paenarthrobacter sp. GOM3]|uniref:aminotransferase class IV n=1 Tax=Paenarthrobacter sp. GOM3 TaxID=2782567 RepID=UPI001BA52AB9|nr:aminotransferase class IV [Paenarthrobacter sp. GOM3]WOH17510.1 aminotransferase class IV [Paenarthrobacter sp. GOM3]
MTADAIRICIDGVDIEHGALTQLATVNYGHFTAMQIRDGQVRGLAKHIKRLQNAHTELFGNVVHPATILERIQQAASAAPNSYLRVTLFETEPGEVHIVTAIRAPVDAPTAAVDLLPVTYQRPVAHIKHVGSFGQLYQGRRARADGFHDALLTTTAGEISETSTANIGFIDSEGDIVWPSANALHGITWQLLDEAFATKGINFRTRPVTLGDLSRFIGSFVASSLGVSGVGKIGGIGSYDANAAREVSRVYAAIPWEPIHRE